MRLLLASLMFVLPFGAHAAVTFSEIAWMGSSASANDEWIELYNNGSTISLDGWTITDGANLSIPLQGSIASGAYAVLERSDDTSAPGSAFLIYTGALANTGLTLYLYRDGGVLEDQVGGGENWENIGGDNVSKETAQKTTGGWKTAVATPGRAYEAIAHEDPDEGEEDEEETESEKTSDSRTVHIEMKQPDVALSLSPQFPEVAYVNQNVVFDVESKGLGKTQLDSLAYEWNYGDLYTQSGKKTTHTYKYPGEYVVTVQGSFAHHEQVARKTITVLPVTFSVGVTETGDVLLQNDAPYEVNISGFALSGKKKFVFPPRSVILEKASITIPKEEIGGTGVVPVVLYDQKQFAVASTYNPPLFTIATAVPQVLGEAVSNADAIEPEVTAESNFSFQEGVTDIASSAAKEVPKPVLSPLAMKDVDTDAIPQNMLPLLGLAGIVTVAIIAVVFGRKNYG